MATTAAPEEEGTPTAVLVGLILLLAAVGIGGLVWWQRRNA
jgi:LPXTG-motif cell wall-anchored protein